MEFRFEYLQCHDCKNRGSCDRCEANLAEKLLSEPEISYVNPEMSAKILSITADLDLPKLEELLRKHEVIVH